MQFRTTFPIAPTDNKISHQTKLLATGSCFAAMVGKRLKERKYEVLSNPFGTIFNPITLFSLLLDSLNQVQPDTNDILCYQDRYLHYQLHSEVSGISSSDLLMKAGQIQKTSRKRLEEASHLFITLGTAWVYRYKETDKLVANCHKQPSSLFSKELLDVEDMDKSFSALYEKLIQANNNISIIITVSPVRHTKDGIPENQISKSLLLVLANQISRKYSNVTYFPSYELMMDDLRDYRFYKEDMIHPTEQAEDYIWGKFEESFINPSDQLLDKEILDINKSISHRPFNPNSIAHQEFLKKLVRKIEQMPEHLDFSSELDKVRSQLL